MSSIADLSTYAEKRYQEGYDYGTKEDSDPDTAMQKSAAFLEGYLKAAYEKSEKQTAILGAIFQQGWNNKVAGKPKSACPYIYDSMERDWWIEGWDNAEGVEATEFLY